MTIPTLKRIKVASLSQLNTWLAKNAEPGSRVMLVTCDKSSRDQYLSNQEVDEALSQHGWQAGRRYTLNGGLIGHVISPAE